MPGNALTRKKIRDNAKALLDGNTAAGASVFISRINKAFVEELPGIFIYTAADTPVFTRKNESTFDRHVNLIIEIVVAQKAETDVVQDIADVIAGQVEDILLPNIYLQFPEPWPTGGAPGPEIISYIQLGPTNLSRADELQADLYGIIMEFDCEYHYEKLTPAGLLEDFEGWNERFKTGDMESERDVTIPVAP